MKNEFGIENSTDFGIIAFLDLDNFKNCMNVMGWTRYAPNPITGYLTNKLEDYIRKFRAIDIWGLNRKEGTEEAILFFYQDQNFVYELMDTLRQEIFIRAKKLNAPTSLSIGICKGKVPKLKKITHHSKNEFKKDPAIFLGYKALKKAKKKGGNCIVQL
jgi:GGDEF domain-containing protein